MRDDGKSATTHHDSYKDFANEFPKLHIARAVRFVEEGTLATFGGPGLRPRSCYARGRKIFSGASGGRHRLQPGVSGSGLEKSILERNICPGDLEPRERFSKGTPPRPS